MAVWFYRFTPDAREDVAKLRAPLVELIGSEPEDEDEDSLRFEIHTTEFNDKVVPGLAKLDYSGEVLCDGENQGYPIEEWTFESGKHTDTDILDSD